MSEFLIDLPLTLKDFQKNWQTVSYTKLSSFQKCGLSWLGGNFGVFQESVASSQEDSAAVGGTIIQRVWESFINDKVFLEIPGRAERVNWMTRNHMALFYAIVFPYETQFEFSKKEARGFFKTTRGQTRLAQMSTEHGLDPRMYKGLQPKFVSEEGLVRVHKKFKSLGEYEKAMRAQYEAMLENFDSKGLDFNKMLSEVFFKSKFQSHYLNGRIDFIYNTNGYSPFENVSGLRDGFVILDGKLQIGPTVSETQLHFYTSALYAQYRILPAATGFIDWSKSSFVWHPQDTEGNPLSPNLSHIDTIYKSVESMQGVAYATMQTLTDMSKKGLKTISLEEVPHLTVTPSKLNCRFCSLGTFCYAAIKAGTNRIPPQPKEEINVV